MDRIEQLDDEFNVINSLLKKRKREIGGKSDTYDNMARKFNNAVDKTKPTDRIKTDREILIEKELELERTNRRRIKENLAELSENEEEGGLENEMEKKKIHPDLNENMENKKLSKRERIEKLIQERLRKSEKIEKDDLLKKKGKITVQEDEEGDEEKDNVSDLEEFNEEGDDGEEGEYDDDDDDGEEGEVDDEVESDHDKFADEEDDASKEIRRKD
jgi:hypothetical protein